MAPRPLDVVVVVDDADDVRAVVVRCLRLSGRFTVVGEGGDGDAAVALAAAHRPDVMVLGAAMTGMDGLEALPKVLEKFPDTRVVLLSGFSAPDLVEAARAAGAADVIDEAFPLEALPERLLQLAGAAEAPSASADDPARTSEAGEDHGHVPAHHLDRFGSLFDQGAIAMATLTLEGTMVRANPVMCEMLGMPETRLVGSRYSSLAPEATADELETCVAAVASGARPVAALEHRIGATDRWVRSTLTSVQAPDGSRLYLFSQMDDVTDRRRAREELEQSQERFRLLVEGVRDYAIFMLDPAGDVTTWNLGAERMKGYRAEEIIGSHFRVFYEPEAQAVRHPEHELELAVANGRYEEEGWRVRKDGSRFWANVVITALFDHDGDLAGFAKVTRGVTERRAALEAMEEANRQLSRAANQTAEFVALTAHELRSPITAMTGAASVLRDYWDAMGEPERLESLQAMLRGGARLQRLIDDLLVVGRLDAGSFPLNVENVRLRRLVDEAVTEHAEGLGPVAVVCPEGLTVRTDPMRCSQMLANLLSNAGVHGDPPVSVQVSVDATSATVQVRDTGVGLPAAEAATVFEKFARGPGGPEAGTGLGLYIVRELARAQGGDAWYEPDAAGACFAFSLPLA